jgi:hypothetical protein
MPETYHLGMVTHKRNVDFGDGFNDGKKMEGNDLPCCSIVLE